MRIKLMAGILFAAATLGTLAARGQKAGGKWSNEERAVLATLVVSELGPVPTDHSNRYADDPEAVRFGKELFFDTRLSGKGDVACATCHLPDKDFQDGIPLAKGAGTTNRRTMPIAGTAHSPWMFWDGRMDSQWSQALGPLESAVEHGGDRVQYARYIATYRKADYERVFGKLPDLAGLPAHAMPNGGGAAVRDAWNAIAATKRDSVNRVFANLGKAIAAFERTINFDTTRFDRYVTTELAGKPHTEMSRFSADEEAGLRLFIGKANCINCHNGPRLTDDHFHNTGVAASAAVTAPDSGRATGVAQVLKGEFNCLSPYSDAKPEQCAELRFAVTEGEELLRAFKTPSLRNVTRRAPFMHAGQIATLEEVIDHYARAPKAPFGKSELKRVRLSANERRQLLAFLETLTSSK